ncbi:hypothetical protein [Georgenia sp. SYP-B2076]|uniref:hypothetical protein n=1 Tax=Georgenia sp. SYP-B2076 TaxID=2495881 RepID=UPI000F8EF57C|nr:hypothetical protein [Georgenia sp. SYP-B2076]
MSRTRAIVPTRGVRLVAVLACGGALLAGCGGGGNEPGPGPSASAPTTPAAPPRSTPPTQSPEVSVEPEAQSAADAAVADLKARPETGGEPVRVLIARRETFPDSALGCPKPGMSYTQVLTEGYRVILARGDREWLYTAGSDGVPSMCPSGEPDGGRAAGTAPTA